MRSEFEQQGEIERTVSGAGDALAVAWALAALDLQGLYLACAGIGGSLDRQQLRGILTGIVEPDRRDYDVIAQALNEHLADLAVSYRAPYAENLPVPDH